MKKLYAFLVITFCIPATFCIGQWVNINSSNQSPVNVSLVSSNAGETVLNMQLNGFNKKIVSTPRGREAIITTPNSTLLLNAGAPDISKVAASIIIPDDATMKVDVIASNYTDYSGIDIAPSKGHLFRNIDPASVPFTYGDVYNQNSFYPGTLAELQNPFIVRDYRGQTVWIYPFQYNPVTKILRVYSEMTLKISVQNNSGINTYNRNSQPVSIDREFAHLYNSLFKNGVSITNYLPLNEDGSMLIISKGSYMNAMADFIKWKAKRGMTCELINVDSIGNNSADIKNYIDGYYATNNLKYILLVGDAQDVATPYLSGGASDPSYGYVIGTDSYAEVIVGRFSAESVMDVQTQVQRTVDYESNPTPGATWYQKGISIGSDQGPGDDNEMDYEHQRNIRAGLLNYGFTLVDELYDGSQGVADANGDPGPSDVVSAINDGRSVINYTGHGSQNSISTTGFSSSNVSSLTNYGMLPFWWSVACVNGEFNAGTCIAEELLRAQTGGEPRGMVATFMSSINQYWNPPMDAQDEFDSLLTFSYVNNEKFSFGGISVNGCIKMNVNYGTSGNDMTDTWHCFGDPSFIVRNTVPVSLTAAHDTIEPLGTSQLLVNCNIDNAVVTITKGSEILGTGLVQNNICTLNFTPVMAIDTFDITATAFNCIPYFGKLYIVDPTGIEENAAVLLNLALSPNPVENFATLDYTLPATAHVTINLYDEQGKLVQNIYESMQHAGNRQVRFSTDLLSQGIYFIDMVAGDQQQVIKMVK